MSAFAGDTIPSFKLHDLAKHVKSVFFSLIAISILYGSCLAVSQLPAESDDQTLVIGSSPEMEIISFSKRVIVKNEAKGVLVFGSDVVVEGKVTGDVAAIGGSVIQREGGFIGGDVIVIGGKYSHDLQEPLREHGKQTVVFAAYEDELRGLAQDPSQLFSPALTPTFFAQRLLSLLFWFLVSLGFVTVAPGAVGRAVARLKLNLGRVLLIGMLGFFSTGAVLVVLFNYAPGYVNVVVAMMAFVVLTIAYAFGRVAMHVATGKTIKKYLISDQNRSEAITIVIGVSVWTVIFSLPYLWTLALLISFSAGIGLVATSRRVQAQ